MTTQERIQATREELNKQQFILKGFEALATLEEIWNTAHYRSVYLNDNQPQPVFGTELDYYARNGILLKEVQSGAKYFKDMDNSEDWPTWKKAAYKAAKEYQEFYDSGLNQTHLYVY